jgi:hypothetical protein
MRETSHQAPKRRRAVVGVALSWDSLMPQYSNETVGNGVMECGAAFLTDQCPTFYFVHRMQVIGPQARGGDQPER